MNISNNAKADPFTAMVQNAKQYQAVSKPPSANTVFRRDSLEIESVFSAYVDEAYSRTALHSPPTQATAFSSVDSTEGVEELDLSDDERKWNAIVAKYAKGFMDPTRICDMLNELSEARLMTEDELSAIASSTIDWLMGEAYDRRADFWNSPARIYHHLYTSIDMFMPKVTLSEVFAGVFEKGLSNGRNYSNEQIEFLEGFYAKVRTM